MIPDSILNLPSCAEALQRQLIQWAEINSGSTHIAGLERMRQTLRDLFSGRTDLTIEEISLRGTDARALRVTCRPDATRRVLLLGHYDTVYAADHPFQSCEVLSDGWLRGPGVADMKGGLLGLVTVIELLSRLPEGANLGWEALFTPDEEIGSTASTPVILESAKRHHLGLVFEPARSTGDLVRSRMGTGNFQLVCHGRAAHAGHVPNPGRNAILALSEFLLELSRLPEEFPGVLANVGRIEGGSTALNVVPDFAKAGINLRITRVADEALVRGRVQELLAKYGAREGYRFEFSGEFDCPPKECGPAEEAVFVEWQKAGHDLAVPAFSWVHTGGGSDGNLLSAAGLPNLDGIGPIGDYLHSEREKCNLASLVQRTQIAALFLSRWAKGELPAVDRMLGTPKG